MCRFFEIIFAAISLVAIGNCSQKYYQDVCSLSIEFKDVCIDYVYNDICVPWNTTNCQIRQISFGEQCLFYNCSVSFD